MRHEHVLDGRASRWRSRRPSLHAAAVAHPWPSRPHGSRRGAGGRSSQRVLRRPRSTGLPSRAAEDGRVPPRMRLGTAARARGGRLVRAVDHVVVAARPTPGGAGRRRPRRRGRRHRGGPAQSSRGARGPPRRAWPRRTGALLLERAVERSPAGQVQTEEGGVGHRDAAVRRWRSTAAAAAAAAAGGDSPRRACAAAATAVAAGSARWRRSGAQTCRRRR